MVASKCGEAVVMDDRVVRAGQIWWQASGARFGVVQEVTRTGARVITFTLDRRLGGRFRSAVWKEGAPKGWDLYHEVKRKVMAR